MKRGKKSLKRIIVGGVFVSGVAFAQASSMACGAGKCGAGKCGSQAPIEDCFEQDEKGECLDKNSTKGEKR